MSSTKYVGLAAVAAGLLTGAQLIPSVASADPVPPPEPPSPTPGQELYNVTYQARIDGVSRNATVSYKIDDHNINSASPTMLPGRTFESTGVVTDPSLAGMRISIDWPYSANLHCEVLVDGQIVAKADTWVGPKLTRQHNDPDYGSLLCGSSLDMPAPVPPVPADQAALPVPADQAVSPVPPAT